MWYMTLRLNPLLRLNGYKVGNMYKTGFDNDKYLKMQSEKILERISLFENKLYLEFGGKLFDDFHASRVLPGFELNSKIKLLKTLADKTEIIMVINASDVEENRIQGDFGITYGDDLIRLINAFRAYGLYVSSVVITLFTGQVAAKMFKQKLEQLDIRVYLHYPIDGYPVNIHHVISEDGFGKNDYIETTKPLVVVTAPGSGSGKMATCFSQLYHEFKRGIRAGYAKFETFPIWNLPLNHPVNLAYEAATTNISDVNLIDPFHLEHYQVSAVNYNRDVEGFPVLNEMFTRIWGASPYKSPTDMGVNMVGMCISDDEVCQNASRQEILRRYFTALVKERTIGGMKQQISTLELLMNKVAVNIEDRPIVDIALQRESDTGSPAMAIMLPSGEIIAGKTSDLLGAASACLLNSLKSLAGADDDLKLISPEMIEPIQKLKLGFLGNANPRLHTDEVLIALSICSASNKDAEIVLEQLPRLRNSEGHSTVILSPVDMNMFRKLGVNMTCTPKHEQKRSLRQE